MSVSDDVRVAVQASLTADGKAYDLNQVMQADPYDYNTNGQVAVLLADIVDRLAKGDPAWALDPNKVDLGQAMTDTVAEFQTDVENAVLASAG